MIVVGTPAVALGAGVDDVSDGIPDEEFRRPLTEHSVSIEVSVRRCTVSQDEQKGEGTKESEDKFP